MRLELRLRRIAGWLGATVAALTLAGISSEALRYGAGLHPLVARVFSLSFEANLPTWYSSTLLLACAGLLAVVAVARRQQRDRWARHWAVLAGIFLYLSLDEAACIHELLNSLFDTRGIIYFFWVLPVGLLVLILGLAYLPFLRDLPPRTRALFVLAGGVYVGGALGVELGLGYWTDLHGSQNFGYALIDMVEESFEILGVSIFLVALLDHVGAELPQLRLRFEPAGAPPLQPPAPPPAAAGADRGQPAP